MVEVLQIKEKFATLRFYISLGGRADLYVDVYSDEGIPSLVIQPEPSETEALEAPEVVVAHDRVRELVDIACSASAHLCQECGKPGSLRKTGWLQTLCDEHFTPEARAEEVALAARRSSSRPASSSNGSSEDDGW